MKTANLALTIVASLAVGITAFAAPRHDDKVPGPALHRIEENTKIAHEYARIYEWNNVNDAVDRIVAAEKKARKALDGRMEMKKEADELHLAVQELRSARLHHDSDRVMAAADRVGSLAQELDK